MGEINDKIKRTVIKELKQTQSPYIQPAWRTSLFLVEGLPIDEAMGIIDKLAKSNQRGFDRVNKKLAEVILEGEDEQAAGS